MISNFTTSHIHHALTGTSDAFKYYNSIPYFGNKFELYENLSRGILGSQRFANLAKSYCNADLISWDICNELEIYYEFKKEGGRNRLDEPTNEYLKDFFKAGLHFMTYSKIINLAALLKKNKIEF